MEVNPIIYPPTAKTDFEKLKCVYALLEQARLEHNRQGAIAHGDPEKYIKTGRWYLYALRPERLGDNVFWKEVMPLLQEQNRLRDNIRKATYTDEQWKALSDEERDAIFINLFGDKEALKKQPTEATYSPLVNLKAISLDSLVETEVPDPTEDFTTYTEVDEDGDLTITADRITVDTMRNDAVSYVRDDKGSGHFGDFEHLTAINIGAYDTNAVLGYWALSNGSNTIEQLIANDDGIDVHVHEHSTLGTRIVIRDFTNDNVDAYDDAPSGNHWLTIERAGTTATCKIYSDSGRTNLEDTLTVTCSTITYQYILGILSRNTAIGSEVASGYNEYLDLQEGGVTEKSSSDSGTGADAKGTGNPLATLVRSETGSGSDAIISRLLEATETGSGVEVAALMAVLISDDAGTGSELSTLPGLEAVFGGDGGSGFDTLKALIETADLGSDMRLHDRPGKVRMPSKGVNL